MRRVGPSAWSACIAAAIASSPAFASIEPDLRVALDAAGKQGRVSAILHLEGAADIAEIAATLDVLAADRAARHRDVVLTLREAALAADRSLIPQLEADRARGVIDRIRPFWIMNAIQVDGSAAAIEAAAAHPSVTVAYLNYEVEHVAPVASEPSPGGVPTESVEPGVEAVRAPEVWSLGYRGEGILVGVVDTGADGSHPAIASRWAGLDDAYAGHPEWAWFDPYSSSPTTFPFDGNASSHGTHVTGTVLGGAPGDSVGVAPGARWISAATIDRGGTIATTVGDTVAAFEWLIDPDGDPATLFDVPHIVTNSWGLRNVHGYPACDELFWSYIDAIEAAGTVVLFAAGNEADAGLRRPADRAVDDFRNLAIGAIDAADPSFPVAEFSSRGPTTCTPNGLPAIKPDLAGPGVAVRSASAGGGYEFKNGTSMATPHVAGVIALMLNANPGLDVDDVKAILFATAVDLGAPGEDSETGHGIVDAVAAVELALETVALQFTVGPSPDRLDPSGGTSIDVTITGDPIPHVAGTGRLHWRVDGGPWIDAPMQVVDADRYTAVFPVLPCGATVDWFFSAENAEGGIGTKPLFPETAFYSAPVFSGETVLVDDDFETAAPGWVVVNVALDDGQWDRGVPAGGGDRGDPAIDWDGSGACWLTDNVDGNSDVDGGPTHLVSPLMDLSGLPAPMLEYARWFSNDDDDTDSLVVEISADDGATWVLVDETAVSSGWTRMRIDLSEYLDPATLTGFRVRFTASDNPNDSITEAGIDAFRISSPFCDPAGVPGDIDGDGVAGFGDLVQLLASFGPCAGCPADFDFDGDVDFDDLLFLLTVFQP